MKSEGNLVAGGEWETVNKKRTKMVIGIGKENEL